MCLHMYTLLADMYTRATVHTYDNKLHHINSPHLLIFLIYLQAELQNIYALATEFQVHKLKTYLHYKQNLLDSFSADRST